MKSFEVHRGAVRLKSDCVGRAVSVRYAQKEVFEQSKIRVVPRNCDFVPKQKCLGILFAKK